MSSILKSFMVTFSKVSEGMSLSTEENPMKALLGLAQIQPVTL